MFKIQNKKEYLFFDSKVRPRRTFRWRSISKSSRLRSNNDLQAFGLIEAVVAIGFLVMVVTSLTYLMRFSLNAARSAGLRTTAYNLAQAEIEKKVVEYPNSLPEITGSSCQTIILNNIDFQTCFKIEPIGPADLVDYWTDYRKMTVTVNWDEKGETRGLELLTYFTNLQ